MPRALPPDQRRVAEEAVRQGLVAAVVMEAAARDWAGQEGEEPFLGYLVRREILAGATVETLSAAVAAESADPAVPVEGGEAAARAPHPSEVIKGYRILERLGRGGMGSVYRAEQAGMNRVVALKILRRPLGAQEEHVERLRREARLVGSLDHPNIVRGLDVGQHGPYHYFAMEFVEGETLRETLKKRGILPEAESLRILEQVCLALDHAHSRGVVHRDVKPGNIILAPDGTPKLTDYGLAKGPADFSLTQSGVTIGTPQYISPEQARDPVNADIQTDLYSLGATAYHMLTGIPPHTSDTLAGLLTKVLYEKPRTARQVNPRVSDGGSFLVEKLMAKEKRYRYRTPREVLRDLRALAAGKSIVPSGWEGDFEVHAVRRRYRVIAALSVAFVLAATGAIFGLQAYAQKQQQLLLEERARSTLDDLLRGENPRTRRGWEQRRDDIEKFLDHPEHAGTPAWHAASREHRIATTRIGNWIKADSSRDEASRLAKAGKHLDGLAGLDRTLEELARAGGEARDAHAGLQEVRREISAGGFEEAEKAATKALEDAERVPIVEGAAVEGVARILERTLERIQSDLVEDPAAAPAAGLQRMLEDLGQARASVEDAHLGPGWKEFRDRAQKAGEFRAADEELSRRAAALREDAVLQGTLARIPLPAAEDLRTRPDRERDRLRALNLRALETVERNALLLESQGSVKDADARLEKAGALGLAELEPRIRGMREAIEKRFRDSLAAGEKAYAEYLDRFFADISRRDYGAARKDLDAAWKGTKTPAGGGARLQAFLEGADFLLVAFEREAFARVRDRIASGADLPLGLRFEEGTRQPHTKVTNVHLRDTPGGAQVLFDTPGIQGLEGSLHRLSLEHLFAYAGIAGEGLTDPQALVKSALVIAEAAADEGQSRVTRKDVENSHARLRRIQASLPHTKPVIDALLEIADAVVERELRKVQDQERLARETFDLALRLLTEEPRDPLESKRLLELLLSGYLSKSEFAKERRGTLEDLLRQALDRIRDGKLQALYPAAAIDEEPGKVSGDTISKVRFAFDSPEPLRGFLPPAEGGARLYSVVAEEANGHAGGGRLRFVAGAGGQELRDNPLELECAFVRSGRPLHVSFNYRSEDPFFLQVSLAGVHIGILTDDGRRTSGRGVFAWHGDDWRSPDSVFPIQYRHDWIARRYAGQEPGKVVIKDGAQRGQRYFQLEAGKDYAIRIEWIQKTLKLFVNAELIWTADLRADPSEDRPRIRIVTFTPCWIDDLVVEGVVDRQHLEKLLRGR